MKLYAISDLHLGSAVNRQAFASLTDHRDDWLILAGDVGETLEHLELAVRLAVRRFAKVLWVPGNHELWTLSAARDAARGHEKYLQLVHLCRSYGVLTPEDPFATWPGAPEPHAIALLFLLYDYSFRPADVTADGAVRWAMQAGVRCVDEDLLHPDPHPSRAAWCRARCAAAEEPLRAAAARGPVVLVNHFPLREDLARLPLLPRFSIWCGTTRTSDWHVRFNARVVVSGHLHLPATTWIDGVRFEEVSFGYPGQRRSRRPIEHYLREILPGAPLPRAR
ncbi:MAG: metallophosphoesterase [Candidatus Binatia bacterium]